MNNNIVSTGENKCFQFHNYVFQLDCKALRAKDLEFIAKSSQMGKGEIVGKFSPPDEWKYPPPDSNENKTYKIVCDL